MNNQAYAYACLSFSYPQDEELARKAEETFNEAWETVNSDGWKVEKQIPEGDIVHSKFVRKNHKIFRITVSICLILPSHFYHFTELFLLLVFLGHNWNPTSRTVRWT